MKGIPTLLCASAGTANNETPRMPAAATLVIGAPIGWAVSLRC